ncbi:MAG TPA: hypothetical protein VFO69_07360 [Allosphingosinicella sp.]|nr:hypothetical protein [Allosphingosinicella sp.]
MMRHFALLAVLAAAPIGVANAQDGSDQETVPISGTVAGICVLGPPSQTAVDLGQMINMSGPDAGRIAPLAAQEVTLPDSFCNFAGTHISVSADALLADDSTTVQPGFARAVNFTSTVTNWATGDATVTTAATAGGAMPTAEASGGTQPLPRIADLELTLNNFTVPSNLRLVAGAYAGSVTITLGPAAAPEGN